MQRLAGEELADRRAQYRTAVAHARVGRAAGTLEVQIPMLAGLVYRLAQQQAAAIAKLRVVGAELVAGIDHCPWFGAAPQLVA